MGSSYVSYPASSIAGGGGGGGSPASPNQSVQFNNSGTFGGSNHFLWDDAQHKLSIFGIPGSFENMQQWVPSGYAFSVVDGFGNIGAHVPGPMAAVDALAIVEIGNIFGSGVTPTSTGNNTSGYAQLPDGTVVTYDLYAKNSGGFYSQTAFMGSTTLGFEATSLSTSQIDGSGSYFSDGTNNFTYTVFSVDGSGLRSLGNATVNFSDSNDGQNFSVQITWTNPTTPPSPANSFLVWNQTTNKAALFGSSPALDDGSWTAYVDPGQFNMAFSISHSDPQGTVNVALFNPSLQVGMGAQVNVAVNPIFDDNGTTGPTWSSQAEPPTPIAIYAIQGNGSSNFLNTVVDSVTASFRAFSGGGSHIIDCYDNTGTLQLYVDQLGTLHGATINATSFAGGQYVGGPYLLNDGAYVSWNEGFISTVSGSVTISLNRGTGVAYSLAGSTTFTAASGELGRTVYIRLRPNGMAYSFSNVTFQNGQVFSVGASGGGEDILGIYSDSAGNYHGYYLSDSLGNNSGNNFISQTQVVSSSGGTTTLTISSARIQTLTGTNPQTYTLPAAGTVPLSLGWTFEFNNQSTGSLTIKDSGGTTLYTIPAGSYGVATCYSISSSPGSWGIHAWVPNPSGASGQPLVSNGSSTGPSFATLGVAGGGTGATSFTPYTLLAAGTASTGPFQNVATTGSVGQALVSNGSLSLPSWNSVGVAGGGTGQASLTAYALLAGGTTGTGAIQQVNTGTVGNVLTSNGASSLPTFQSLIAASNNLTGQTTAGTVITFTPSSDGNYRVGGYVTITAISVDVLNLQVTYTDETSTVRTQNFFPQGVTSASLATTGAFIFPTMDIRVKSGTTITLKTNQAVGGGSQTFDVGGSIQKVF